MTHGRTICQQLKTVRSRIAEENNIPLKIEECTYQGECRGTCPKCEAEVRYLENALASRLLIGKVATVAGLALGLAATATQAQAQVPADSIPHPQDTNIQQVGVIKGSVVDIKTNKPIPYPSVVVYKNSMQYSGTIANLIGMFTLKVPPGDNYDIRIMANGYQPYVRTGVTVLPTGFTSIGAELRPTGEPDGTITLGMTPVIQVGGIESDFYPGNPPFQHLNVEGVKVIVR